MGQSIAVMKCDTGYVLFDNGNPLAGCSTIDDVSRFLRRHFDEEPRPFASMGEQIWDRLRAVPDRQGAAAAEPPASAPATVEDVAEALSAIEVPASAASSQPDPAPAAPQRLVGGVTLTANQEKVYDHLCLCAVKTGSETVTIDYKILAQKAGVADGNLHYLLGELQRKKLIDWKKGGTNASPTFTVHGALDGLEPEE